MEEALDHPANMPGNDISGALVDSDATVYPSAQDFSDNSGFEPMDTSVYPVGTSSDVRELDKISDHITVWVDKYIGAPGGYAQFKSKFEDLHVLRSNLTEQNEVDDDVMLFANRDMLTKLMDVVYCLKYFCEVSEAVQFILQNPEKRIFFISSGSIGKEIVPQIAELTQIQGIYIFCGNISAHIEWAAEYVDNISAMLEHQDNLLTRLSRDLSEYLEKKGDRYKQEEAIIAARNCYAWAKKLLLRAKKLGDNGVTQFVARLDGKIAEVLASKESS